jgi:lipopolysaccharide biosynthesis glycosyltransferase
MNTKKKERAIVFGLTSNYAFAVACVMLDIKRLCPAIADEIVIIHDGISESDKRLLAGILPTRFIDYEFPITSKKVFYSKAIQHFTKMVFTKFECLHLLNEYKAVMWLDYDIVLQDDISELFAPVACGIKMMPGGMKVRDQIISEVSGYDLECEGVVASTFIFFDNLPNYNNLHGYCYEQLKKHAEILYMPEQAIFDFMIQDFNLRPISINPRLYTPHPSSSDAINAKIIHAFGQPKFWNGLSNDRWDLNYQSWVMQGGTRYKPKGKINRLLTKLKNRFQRILCS